MTSIEQNLTQYAAYHRDRRNIATHFVGVPMIVFSVVLALAVVGIPLGPVVLTLAAAASIAACIYYVKLEPTLGLTMAVVLFLMCAAASEITHRTGTAASLGIAAAVFVVGWIIQFVGHRFEGMKPAFFDDVKQLLIGPLFVAAEAYFLLGGLPQLRRYIEDRVGPTVARRDGRPIPIREEEVAS
ncbi:MAG TPA: Mpo1-like protein [Usitatibacter sp.]|nr:Mpo1-like protein [Usitatibacter sp.]